MQMIPDYDMIEKIALKKYDSKGMSDAYDLWPKLSAESYEKSIKFDINFDDIDHIVFVGMGGSGAAGEILRGVLSKSNIHTTVVKGYTLPRTVDSNTLIFTTSISGNSVEPLATLEQSKNTRAQIVCFSSGGKMQDYCLKNKVNYHQIKQVNSPRASLPIVLYSMLSILGGKFGIKTEDITESISLLEKTSKKIDSKNIAPDNPSLTLGEWITKIPVIYYPYGLYAAALRFKNSLQENSKRHAMIEDVIEASHNNIVSWEKPAPVQPVLVRGADDYVKTKERWEILKQYFNDNNIEFHEVMSVKGSILSKLINLIYVLDYATIYNAAINKIDPTPIKSIDFIKSKL